MAVPARGAWEEVDEECNLMTSVLVSPPEGHGIELGAAAEVQGRTLLPLVSWPSSSPKRGTLRVLGGMVTIGVLLLGSRALARASAMEPATDSRPQASGLQMLANSQCAASDEDCGAKGCCNTPGEKCFRKNAYWAGCKKTCTPGDGEKDWNCAIVNPPETAAAAAALPTAPTINPAWTQGQHPAVCSDGTLPDGLGGCLGEAWGDGTMTFYMYRAQSEQEYNLENINAASLAGVMWYLHNEVVRPYCPRHYGVTRIMRMRVTVRNPSDMPDRFSEFVAFDKGRCTTPDCPLKWQKFGYSVGCQKQMQTTYAPNPVWYSLPGVCPSADYLGKSAACREAEPGGKCTPGELSWPRVPVAPAVPEAAVPVPFAGVDAFAGMTPAAAAAFDAGVPSAGGINDQAPVAGDFVPGIPDSAAGDVVPGIPVDAAGAPADSLQAAWPDTPPPGLVNVQAAYEVGGAVRTGRLLQQDPAQAVHQCTWSMEEAGEINIAELEGIDNWDAFCNSGGGEYDKGLDHGTRNGFWDNKGDQKRNEMRMDAVKQLFRRKFPDLPIDLPDPQCPWG